MVRISSPTYVVRQNFSTRKLNDASARLKNIRLNFIYERGGGGVVKKQQFSYHFIETFAKKLIVRNIRIILWG